MFGLLIWLSSTRSFGSLPLFTFHVIPICLFCSCFVTVFHRVYFNIHDFTNSNASLFRTRSIVYMVQAINIRGMIYYIYRLIFSFFPLVAFLFLFLLSFFSVFIFSVRRFFFSSFIFRTFGSLWSSAEYILNPLFYTGCQPLNLWGN